MGGEVGARFVVVINCDFHRGRICGLETPRSYLTIVEMDMGYPP